MASKDVFFGKNVPFEKEDDGQQYRMEVGRYAPKILVDNIRIFGIGHRMGLQMNNALQDIFKQGIRNHFAGSKKQFHVPTLIESKHIQKAQ